MTARTRDASPKPTKKEPAEGETKAEAEAKKFTPPARPQGLRESLLSLYGLLAVIVLIFAIIGQLMTEHVPEGKFKLKDGKLIPIGDYDVSDLGPYPKCHPHFEEHQTKAENGTMIWIKNKDAPKGGPYPAGHPENPEWVALSDERVKAENRENRFKWKGLQPNLHLLLLGTLTVFLGSKHAVWGFTEPAETRQAGPQVLQSEDAAWFPVMGSAVLFGLFLVLKYMGTYWIKTLITCWIVMICTFGVGKNADEIVSVWRAKASKPLFRIPYFDEAVTPIQLVGCCVGASMAAGYIFTKNWIVNNVFGLSFCALGIRMIGVSSFKVSAIMLIGLFFYDVFWVFGSKSVFGSNVMVSVAMGVEAPIKLMFPRDLGGCGTLRHSMLGLGDIVVPGLFIAFLAKWDAVKMDQKASDQFVYLNSVMVAYFLSLVTTVSIMLFFNAAQPALLYIVPYVLITSVAVALVRGEFKELWAFEIPDESEAEEKKSDGKEEKTD